MWVQFMHDPKIPSMGFEPGEQVEVPDEVIRRWQLVFELFNLLRDEMGDWKARGWAPETKALPEKVSVTLPLREVS